VSDETVDMRFPRASAVIVALSTFVAVATVAALVSQLSPLDRAGAVLPEGPITTTGHPADPDADEPTATAVEPAPPSAVPGASDPGANPGPSPSTQNPSTNQGSDGVTVVAPAPAEPVTPDPEPTTPPNQGNNGGGPENPPGNSGNAPGLNRP
jgi:hypothetical protein